MEREDQETSHSAATNTREDDASREKGGAQEEPDAVNNPEDPSPLSHLKCSTQRGGTRPPRSCLLHLFVFLVDKRTGGQL
jgi:hypothetical protein